MMWSSVLGYSVVGIHEAPNAVEAVKQAQAIYIGGGNTFQLLKTLYDLNLIQPIQDRVLKVCKYNNYINKITLYIIFRTAFRTLEAQQAAMLPLPVSTQQMICQLFGPLP
jgi:hypothetical protein